MVLGQWCRTFFAGLVAAGVRQVVISPGSRSTPLVMQALREEALECHAVLDERSAGFFALGLASLGGPPPLLICTSGSAMAHYFPAVIEAHMAGLPLLVLTADRPTELQGCGAAQTIRQDHLFSSYAQSAPPLGAVSARPQALRSLLRKAVQAVAQSQGPLPGPVHVNFQVAKPLEIEEAASVQEVEFCAMVDEIIQKQPQAPPRALVVPAQSQLEDLVPILLKGNKRTCVTLGPASEKEAALAGDLARLLGAPLLTELPHSSISPAPLDAVFSSWLQPGNHFLPPERLIHVGDACFSAKWLEFLETGEAELWCVPGPVWKDPSNRAIQVLLGDLAATLTLLCSQIGAARPDSFPELDELLAACLEARKAAEDGLADRGCLPELLVCQELLQAAPAGANVLLGNSLSVRLAAWAAPDGVAATSYFVQRGANGIDGQIARSSGIAQGSSRPTLAVLGDVTAAHDLGSLLLARGLEVPLLIAVLDNDGGHLFDHLPVAKKYARDENYRFWTTPPRIHWQAAAQAYGVHFERCESLTEIRAAVARGMSRNGVTLLHLAVDTASTHEFLARCRALAPIKSESGA